MALFKRENKNVKETKHLATILQGIYPDYNFYVQTHDYDRSYSFICQYGPHISSVRVDRPRDGFFSKDEVLRIAEVSVEGLEDYIEGKITRSREVELSD